MNITGMTEYGAFITSGAVAIGLHAQNVPAHETMIAELQSLLDRAKNDPLVLPRLAAYAIFAARMVALSPAEPDRIPVFGSDSDQPIAYVNK